ncbi:MAG: hypothetical protein ACXACU_15855 [Candidatus Hodarchaeales archaeon]
MKDINLINANKYIVMSFSACRNWDVVERRFSTEEEALFYLQAHYPQYCLNATAYTVAKIERWLIDE